MNKLETVLGDIEDSPKDLSDGLEVGTNIEKMFENMGMTKDLSQLKDIPKEFISRGYHPQISFVIDSDSPKVSIVLDIIRKIQTVPQNVTVDGKKSRLEFETLIRSTQNLDTKSIQNCFVSETDLNEPRGIIILKLKDNFEETLEIVPDENYEWFVICSIKEFIRNSYRPDNEDYLFLISARLPK